MCCDWHTSRYCHVRLGLCSWACELIPMASKSTPPPTLLHLHHSSLLPSPPSFPRFFPFYIQPCRFTVYLQWTLWKAVLCWKQIERENKTAGQTGLISKTNLDSLINSIQKGHPQVRASQRNKGADGSSCFVLSWYTSPDDKADREEQSTAHGRQKDKLWGPLWGDIRKRKQRLNHSAMSQRALRDTEARKKPQQAKNLTWKIYVRPSLFCL